METTNARIAAIMQLYLTNDHLASKRQFAASLGIPKTTFYRWVRLYNLSSSPTVKGTPVKPNNVPRRPSYDYDSLRSHLNHIETHLDAIRKLIMEANLHETHT